MSTVREYAAEHMRTMVGLNLHDLNAILAGLASLAAGDRAASRELRPLARRIESARDRRQRAVSRAGA